MTLEEENGLLRARCAELEGRAATCDRAIVDANVSLKEWAQKVAMVGQYVGFSGDEPAHEIAELVQFKKNQLEETERRERRLQEVNDGLTRDLAAAMSTQP